MTAPMNKVSLGHGRPPPPLPKSPPTLHDAPRNGPTHVGLARAAPIPVLKLAGGCLIASALGAALVIGANDAVKVGVHQTIPAPRIANRMHAKLLPPTSLKPPGINSPARKQSLYLVRSTLLALDQANRTGNYSVLRALGTPSFQQRNSSADLAVIFSSLRRNKIDMAEVAILKPKWQHPTRNGTDGLKLRGLIPMANRQIFFDMQFKSIHGNWNIYALTVSAQMPRPGTGNAAASNDTAKRKTQSAGQSRSTVSAPTG